MIGLLVRDGQDRTARIVLLQTARAEQKGEDSQKRSARAEQLEQDSQNGTDRTERAEKDRQDRAVRTALPR
jgi:hypothetical protein